MYYATGTSPPEPHPPPVSSTTTTATAVLRRSSAAPPPPPHSYHATALPYTAPLPQGGSGGSGGGGRYYSRSDAPSPLYAAVGGYYGEAAGAPGVSPRPFAAATWAPTSNVVSSTPPSANMAADSPRRRQRQQQYTHNRRIALLWIPCWWAIFLPNAASPNSESINDNPVVPLQWFWMSFLLVYCLDLANVRDATLYVLWLVVLLLSAVTLWYALWRPNVDQMVTNLLHGAVAVLFYACSACWGCLQCEWLVVPDTCHYPHSTVRQLETALHAVLPPVFASVVTTAILQQQQLPTDSAATLAPHLFAVLLVTSMLTTGAARSSFVPPAVPATDDDDDNGDDKKSHHDNNNAVWNDLRSNCSIPNRVAWGHLALTLFTPVLMHLIMFQGRMTSRYAATDDLWEVLLAGTIPLVLVMGVQWLHSHQLLVTPHGAIATKMLRNWSYFPFVVLVVASVALQQRYLIPICHQFSVHMMNVQMSTLLISVYWSMATASTMAAFCIWGRSSPLTGQLMFGDYHDDIVQLCLAAAGLCLGKAFGLPWNMTPLPILGLLGLSLWMTTRMLRYLSIFLFVMHATGVVVFTYRFIGIDQVMKLPVANAELSLTRFGLVVTVASILIGLETGLAVRSNGGYMAPMLRKFEVSGIVLICYTVLMAILEISLLKREIPMKELAGVEVEEDHVEEMLYDPMIAYFTSGILVAMCLFMKHVRILRERTSSIILSLAVAKAVAIYIDAAERDNGGTNADPQGARVFLRFGLGTLLGVIMFVPRVFLPQVHVKTIRQKRAMNGGPALPAKAMRIMFFYAFVLLPLALIATIPDVLFPLVNVVSGGYSQESYYNVSSPISEFVGAVVALWGLACLSALNSYLPDGGGEAWKKLSALAFLMGIGIFLSAPTVGMSVGTASNNPYASVSSLGVQLINRGKSRTGGWGILSAAFATLLAVVGPLELKERRYSSGRKDRYLLLRSMIFSLLFGGGVAWFITVQNMSESEWVILILTLMASMALAFFATVASVLGFFIEVDKFDEVEQIAKFWFFILCLFLPIGGIPQLIRPGASHPFGTGGWLSTYLIVGELSAFGFAASLRFRHVKDQRTRGLGNMGCVISWLCAVTSLYGSFGVAGLDEDDTFVGLPTSVIGTIAVAPILLCLEGEHFARSRGRRITVTTTNRVVDDSLLRLQLPQLTRENRWFPLFAGTVAVFLLASLYAITLRGSGLFTLFGQPVASDFGEEKPEVRELDLAALVERTISSNLVLSTSARLADCGFWTAKGFLEPLLHLAGVFATLPSLYLLTSQYWLGKLVPSAQVLFGLPFSLVPLTLCRYLPSLRSAALFTMASAAMQLYGLRQAEHDNRMRI